MKGVPASARTCHGHLVRFSERGRVFVHVEFEIEDHRRRSVDIGDHDYGVLHSASLPMLVCDAGKRVRADDLRFIRDG